MEALIRKRAGENAPTSTLLRWLHRFVYDTLTSLYGWSIVRIHRRNYDNPVKDSLTEKANLKAVANLNDSETEKI
jgi:hypothetical protein